MILLPKSSLLQRGRRGSVFRLLPLALYPPICLNRNENGTAMESRMWLGEKGIALDRLSRRGGREAMKRNRMLWVVGALLLVVVALSQLGAQDEEGAVRAQAFALENAAGELVGMLGTDSDGVPSWPWGPRRARS